MVMLVPTTSDGNPYGCLEILCNCVALVNCKQLLHEATFDVYTRTSLVDVTLYQLHVGLHERQKEVTRSCGGQDSVHTRAIRRYNL